MNDAPRKWDDLKARVLTAIAMVVVGGLALWAGGLWFLALLVLAVTLMLWELGRMLNAPQRVLVLVLADIGGLALLALAMGFGVPWYVLLALAPVLGAIMLHEHRLVYLCYGVIIMGGAAAMQMLRQDLGLGWILWLVVVVVVTDIAGYFVGRIVGGPKFWPRVSPRKTWSGTAGGWVAAALVGAAFSGALGAGPVLVALSIGLSFASQLGDIAESAIKRLSGVKDSSNLLPGHGGLLDRFDGMLGAAFAVLIAVSLRPDIFGLT